jgi:DNA-binding XRE family transcriptional regulator
MNKEIIGIKIKEGRKRFGWTQSQLAKETGTTLQTINTIEKGKANTTIELLLKIEEVLILEIFK